MNKEKTELNVLDELNKGATMGMDAIEFIIDKVTEEDLKKELKREYDAYKKISKEICKIYPKKNKEPHSTNFMNQYMTWKGIELNTLMDKSTSKLAEMLIQGVNMGIIEGRRLLNQEKDVTPKINELLSEYVDMQEEALDNLKEFL